MGGDCAECAGSAGEGHGCDTFRQRGCKSRWPALKRGILLMRKKRRLIVFYSWLSPRTACPTRSDVASRQPCETGSISSSRCMKGSRTSTRVRFCSPPHLELTDKRCPCSGAWSHLHPPPRRARRADISGNMARSLVICRDPLQAVHKGLTPPPYPPVSC